jgi:cation diffusion facilitator CzcD-associated flavoprotein CzcO
MTDIVIIGAGPFGLSLAAHLRARGIGFRIFGRPMQAWTENMPRGVRLKSESFASSLYDPESTFTLADYCRENNLPYSDIGLPVPLETFAAYGLEFQRRRFIFRRVARRRALKAENLHTKFPPPVAS